MQLTKLEAKGFKSFGDKITINFGQGITGIVGPNGCGKSNVVDSIRWVLGEQRSRMLRSDKMENVIFNGTKNRKPTQMAEVSLSFDNTKNLLPTEYTSVTITRRYYRTGDSEYLLNGVVCRLKDITNLFLDTGIASNSYSIIELKMVDDILNDKDGSRRALFEEAASISKFKKRKKESLKKLNSTDQDLDRVEDLLFEIEKNLKSLEKQAKQADRYHKIKAEYKETSVLYAKKSFGNKKEQLEELEQNIESFEDRKIGLNTQFTQNESQIEELKKERVKAEQLLSTRQKTLNEFVNSIRQFESDKKIKNERLKFLNSKADQLQEQINQDKKSQDRAEFSIKGLSKEKEEASKILAETEELLTELREQNEEKKEENDQIQELVNVLNNQYRELKDKSYQTSKNVEVKQMQLATFKQELEQASSDTTTHTISMEEFETRANELSSQLEKKQKQLSQFKNKQTELMTRIENTDSLINSIKDEINAKVRERDSKQNEYNLTKSLVENLEGYPEAIKFLKKKSGWGKNFPLLSDILTCPADYRLTIEGYLEQYMNYYVVETYQDAIEAVNVLKDSAKGKANFFVVESFQNYKANHVAINHQATPATEIVEYDEHYSKLIAWLLENVYIVDGKPEEYLDTKAIILTKDGSFMKKRFSIKGGSTGLFEGKRIGRAKNLEKLQKSIADLNKKIDKIKSSLSEKQTEVEQLKASQVKDQIEELTDEIAQTNAEYVSFKTKYEQTASLISNQSMKKEDIQDRIVQIEEEIENLLPEQDEITIDLQRIEEDLLMEKDNLSVSKEAMMLTSSRFNEQNILFHQKSSRVASIDQEIQHKEMTKVTTQERIHKNVSEAKLNEEEIKRILETSDENETDLLEMYTEKESIELGVNEAEKTFYKIRGDIDKIENTNKEIQRQRNSLDEQLIGFKDKRNEVKLSLASVKERLSVEFDMDLDTVLKEEDDPNSPFAALDEEELQNKVQQCKMRLERMGPINPMAKEAYDEIQERHVFITSQKEDLLNAKQTLLDTIGEIETHAKETFLTTFEEIKTNFVQVFRSLFTEDDDCDLILTNPDDPLESPIDIIAKPKGKRPLTINQLSGGEKTLTATSLLFSLYLLKPAPFCIFDEVDAPLDDANIDKFNNIIKKFSADSQFIIVTHNKRTMSTTDVIYGVTMVEQGVSRVIPADLTSLA